MTGRDDEPGMDGAATALPAVVLAAGEGRRFRTAGGTGHKVLARLDGSPLLAHVLDTANAARLDPVVLVVGPDLAAHRGLADLIDGRSTVRVVVNPDAARGMGTSLAAGLGELAGEPRAPACVVLLGDQPGIAATVVREVLDAWRRSGRPARVRYSDGASHPVVLPAELWPTLIGRAGTGARDVLDDMDVAEVVVDAPAPPDVDVPDDLRTVSRP